MKLKTTLLFIVAAFLTAQPSFGSDPSYPEVSDKKPKVGILLSGGGALGFAHIGVLKALEEEGVSPQYIAGASMGALVGTFYSYGYSPDFIHDMVISEKLYIKDKIFAITGAENKGLAIYTHKKVRNLLDKYIKTDNFDGLKREMVMTVSNLTDSRTEAISSGGHLKEFLLASMSIPAVFEPVIINNKIYVDGGSLNHFPAYVLRDKVDVLIGVDVMPEKDTVRVTKLTEVVTSYIHSLAIVSSIPGRKACDYLIDCHAINEYAMLEFDKFNEIYDYGYNMMKDYIKEHPEMIEACKHFPVEEEPDKKQEPEKKKWYEFWK